MLPTLDVPRSLSATSARRERGAHPRGVRGTLALLALGSILPVVLVAALVIVNLYQRERDRLIASTINQARAARQAVDSEFASTQSALLALATSRQLAERDYAGFHGRATAALRNIKADSIVIVGLDGQLLMSTRRAYGSKLPRLARTPLLQRIIASGSPGVSGLFDGPLTGQQIYTVAVPIWSEGAVAMTLNATSAPATLQTLLWEQKLPAAWRASILDSQGHIVARSHDAERFIGKAVPADVLARMRGEEGSFEAVTLEGIEVLSVYSRSAASGWSALIGIPRAELTGALQRDIAALTAAALAATGLGLLLAWRLSGGIARSMHALIEPALAVGRGDKPVIAQLPIREANEVAAALRMASGAVRAAQAETLESSQRLALAADAARLGIWIRHLQSAEIWGSERWRSLLGFSPGETVTESGLLARVHEEDRAAVSTVLAESAMGLPRYEMEYRVHLPGGALRWFASRGSVEFDAAGNPLLVRGVTLDITERKQAELDLQQKQLEVTRLGRVAVMGELSGALAHELNQPLTAILSNAQAAQHFLRQEPPPLQEVAEILEDIVAEDRRAGDVIARLRRLFDGGESMRQRIGANALVEEALRLLKNELIARGVTLQTALAPEELWLNGDPVQLQQVLINLLVNACDAQEGQPRPTIAVQVHQRDADWIEISVRDNGPGIAADRLERIFEAFYTTKKHGMGLGLSICRKIALAHGGHLAAANNAAGGSTFRLLLPAEAA